jgi:glycosyltransferase involved in cell wall biosynthesis
MKLSVVVNTYNQPTALALTLFSLLKQSETDFEVVIADDGSREDTWKLIERFQTLFGKRLSHQWQQDKGGRQAKILNRAFEVCRADRVIVLDKNSFVHRNFVRDHLLQSKKCDVFLGARILIGANLSDFVLEKPSRMDTLEFWRRAFLAKTEDEVGGFNLSLGKRAFEQVQGFDESSGSGKKLFQNFFERLQVSGAEIRESRNSAVAWCLELGPELRIKIPSGVRRHSEEHHTARDADL